MNATRSRPTVPDGGRSTGNRKRLAGGAWMNHDRQSRAGRSRSERGGPAGPSSAPAGAASAADGAGPAPVQVASGRDGPACPAPSSDGSSGPGPASAPAPASSSSRIQPPAARRARRWYSGPCLRGSAHSLGLIVQYVPLAAPYQPAPLQPGSNGSSSPGSYDV